MGSSQSAIIALDLSGNPGWKDTANNIKQKLSNFLKINRKEQTLQRQKLKRKRANDIASMSVNNQK